MNLKATKRECELVAALKNYGSHRHGCAVARIVEKVGGTLGWAAMAGDAKHCTCGLAAAIRGGGR